MPNWCMNNIVIVGGTKKLQKVKANVLGRDVAFECVGEGGGVAFDKETLFCFHKLVPQCRGWWQEGNMTRSAINGVVSIGGLSGKPERLTY